MDVKHIENLIRDVPDFPVEGILFKDITTVLQDPKGMKFAVDAMTEQGKTYQPDLIVGIESRGFMFGMPMAYQLDLGFVPVRKPGKLPAEHISETYTLEYGSNTLEIHTDAVKSGQRVLVVDDLLATGGTAQATARLIERLGGEVVGFVFMIELDFLNGRDALAEYDVYSLIKVD